jgi:hypothetical protein
MNLEEMNEGVRIIIDRIKTNPEEFNNGVHERWYDIMHNVARRAEGKENALPFLYDEEIQAIYNQLREMSREDFTGQVLRRLAGTPSEEDDGQLDLPYARAVPSRTNRRSPRLTISELKEAKSLGVTPEVYAEAKVKEWNHNRMLADLKKAHEERKAKQGNP